MQFAARILARDELHETEEIRGGVALAQGVSDFAEGRRPDVHRAHDS